MQINTAWTLCCGPAIPIAQTNPLCCVKQHRYKWSKHKLCIPVAFFFLELHIWMRVLYSIFYFFWDVLPTLVAESCWGEKNACQFIFNNVHLLGCLVIEDNVENNFLQAVKWDHLTCRRVVLSGSPAWHNWTVKVRLSGRMCCCLFYFTVFPRCDSVTRPLDHLDQMST